MNTCCYCYTKSYDIDYYNQNMNGTIKESVLLNYLQEIATEHAEQLGIGPSYVFKNNYAWVVLRYKLELNRELNNLKQLTIKTESRGIAKIYAFRDFELFDESNQSLGRVTSTWALIDMSSRKVLPIHQLLKDQFPTFQKRENDLTYSKTEIAKERELSQDFLVRFDDIDINQHVNNSTYLTWILEAIPGNFRKEYYPKQLDIRYKKEAQLGDKISSQAHYDPEILQSTHLVSNTQYEAVEAVIQWGKRTQQGPRKHP